MKIKFRENFITGRVVCTVDGKFVISDSEYRTVAEYARDRFGLDDEALMDIYRDYKRDYDSY